MPPRGGTQAGQRHREALPPRQISCKILPVFNIEMANPFDNVPRDLLAELQARLREIGGTLETMPAESEMWPSLLGSVMLLDVEGWRFQYRVDVKGRRLVVDSAVFSGRK